MSFAGRQAESFADPTFETVWQRTDQPRAAGRAARSWMWGPEPLTGAVNEPYAEAPGGTRTVQYFDKSRMEINDPTADRAGAWFVTNGLLVRELVDGLNTATMSSRRPSPGPPRSPSTTTTNTCRSKGSCCSTVESGAPGHR